MGSDVFSVVHAFSWLCGIKKEKSLYVFYLNGIHRNMSREISLKENKPRGGGARL